MVMLRLLLSHKIFLSAQAAVQSAAVSITAADSGSADTIKVSIIGGIFLVLAAAIPAWISTRHREGDPSTRALIASGRRLERDYAELLARHEQCGKTIDGLETMLWKAGINPHTGERT